jgi:hypothetical protein
VDCDFLSDIEITTQEEMDDFAAEGCATIDVSLRIGGKNVTSLAGLQPLREIKGTFEIGVWNVTDVSPLAHLERVEGSITITNMDSIESLKLLSLNYVGSDFYLTDMDIMTSLSMPKLKELGGWLNINSNPKLETIAMGKLAKLDRLTILGNEELLTFGGLPSLNSIDMLSLPSTFDRRCLRDKCVWNTWVRAFRQSSSEPQRSRVHIEASDQGSGIAPEHYP